MKAQEYSGKRYQAGKYESTYEENGKGSEEHYESQGHKWQCRMSRRKRIGYWRHESRSDIFIRNERSFSSNDIFQEKFRHKYGYKNTNYETIGENYLSSKK